MHLRLLLLPIVLAFTVLFSVNFALAETVVDLDIIVDTTWTKEMSPIIIKGSTRSDKIRRVTNGAILTIEPGVEIRFDYGMSLYVTRRCLRGYSIDTCYRNSEDEIKMPKLIARGTSVQPIIFTSNQEVLQPGDWGSVIIDAQDSEVEWVEFRYGGMSSKRSFVEINNSFFENNLIENGGDASFALFITSQKVEGNVIRQNGGNAIFCSHKCEIKNNFISQNPGNAIRFDVKRETKITGNFILQNGGNAIESESIYSQLVTIEDNSLRENGGGIYIHRSSPDLKINCNNFFQNSNFAIKSDINNRVGRIYLAEENWFGIDTGSQNSDGQFFVSEDFDVSKFAKEENNLAIAGGSKAARIYREYFSENNLEESFFTAKVSRKNLIGNTSLPGSLLQYSVTFGNHTTEAKSNAQLAVSMPADQNLLLCSVQSTAPNFSYSLQDICTGTLSNEFAFENNQLVWRPDSVAAFDEQAFSFVMMLSPTAKNTASLPRLDFDGKPFSYRLGSNIQLEEHEEIAQNLSSEVQETPTSPKVQTPILTEASEVEEEQPVSSVIPADDGTLATGTVSRQVIGTVLNYVLTTSDGKEYSLYNKWRWRDIDNFTKSADKDKSIAVYGDFYLNRFGVATGIKFTRFEIR